MHSPIGEIYHRAMQFLSKILSKIIIGLVILCLSVAAKNSPQANIKGIIYYFIAFSMNFFGFYSFFHQRLYI